MSGVYVECGGVPFERDKIRNVKIVQELDPISSKISINTASITINSENGEKFFANGKDVLVRFDNVLICKTFISYAKQKSQNVWEIKSEDYIGLLDDVTFVGGVYEHKNAKELFSEILNTAGVSSFSIIGFENEVVWGHIPYTNCREALKQVAFAVGAVIDTSNSDLIKVYKLDKIVSQTIPTSRVLQGVSVEEKLPKKTITMTSYLYLGYDEREELFKKVGEQEENNVLVVFEHPHVNLEITNGAIVESGVNYAIINASAGCSLTGNKVFVEKITKQATQNGESVDGVTTVSDATCIHPGNVGSAIIRLSDFFENKLKIKAKIIEGKHEKQNGFVLYGDKNYGEFFYGQRKKPEYENDKKVNVGETVIIEMPYGKNIQAIVVKQSYSLNGGIIIKDTELVGDYIES